MTERDAIGTRPGRAVVRLNEWMIAAVLGVPEGVRVIGVRDDFPTMSVLVMVEGDTLPEHIEAAYPEELPVRYEYVAGVPGAAGFFVDYGDGVKRTPVAERLIKDGWLPPDRVAELRALADGGWPEQVYDAESLGARMLGLIDGRLSLSEAQDY